MANPVSVVVGPEATAGMEPSTAAAIAAASSANIVSLVLVPAAVAMLVFYLFGDVGGGKARGLPVANPPTALVEKAIEMRPSMMRDGIKALREASKRFAGKPFRLVTHTGPITIVPPSVANEIRNHAALDFRKRIREDFPSRLPGMEAFSLLDRPDQLLQMVIKKHLNKRMNAVTGPLAMETSFSVDNELGTKSDWTEVPIYGSVLDMVARLSTRIFLGQELCRNDEWLEVTKHYTIIATSIARVLRTWPRFLWPVVCHFYPEYRRVRDISRRSQKLIRGVVEARRRQRADCQAKGVDAPEYNDVLTWIEKEAGNDPYDPAIIQLTLSFAATHTTTDLVAQLMVRLAADPELIEPLRKEAVEVLGAEGWSKQSLYKLKLMDSALKETQRMKPINNLAMQRLVLQDTELQGGIKLRKGDRLALDAELTLMNPELYPEPEKFDIYRFYRVRESGEAGAEAKAQLVSTSADFVAPFGYGKHACPGRFFAAAEIKILLVYMLLNYDWKMADGVPPVPNIWLGTDCMLKPGTKLVYKSRKAEIDLDSLEFDAGAEE